MAIVRRWALPFTAVIFCGLLAGCTTSDLPAPVHGPHHSSVAAGLEIPDSMPGELARATITSEPIVTLARKTEGKTTPKRSFFVHAACQAKDPEHKITYRVIIGGRFSSSVTLPCDGKWVGNSESGVDKRSTVRVQLTNSPDDVIRAFVVASNTP